MLPTCRKLHTRLFYRLAVRLSRHRLFDLSWVYSIAAIDRWLSDSSHAHQNRSRATRDHRREEWRQPHGYPLQFDIHFSHFPGWLFNEIRINESAISQSRSVQYNRRDLGQPRWGIGGLQLD